MATTIVTKNSSTAAAVPTAAQLVQGELAVNVADGRLYTEDNAAAIVELGVNPATEITANAGIALPDSQKATFGADDDLQIYHDGNNSFVADQGTGALVLQSNGTFTLIQNSSGVANARFDSAGATSLRYNGAEKLATTSTGIDVTGTATMDGLTVENNTADVKGTVKNTLTGGTRTATLDIIPQNDGAYGVSIQASGGAGTGTFQFNNKNIMKFDLNNDISFYEDTGTTAKLFWDASAESLGIGTSSPQHKIDAIGNIRSANSTNTAGQSANVFTATYNSNFGQTNSATFQSVLNNATTGENDLFIKQFNHNSGSTDDIVLKAASGNSGYTALYTADTERMRIDSSGVTTFKYNTKVYTAGYPETRLGITDSNYFNFTFDNPNDSLAIGKNGSTKMSLTASGNLLVGKTSSSIATAGTAIRGDNPGLINSVRNGVILELNRLSTDGDIVDFFKDGTSVGSIGVTQGIYPFMGHSGTGITFAHNVNAIMPYRPSSDDYGDGLIDIGRTNGRFKDLYLSGNISAGSGGANNNNYQIRVSAGTTGLSRFIAADTSDSGYIDYDHSSDSWIHRTAGTERMRIDSSGNLALGDSNAYTHRLFVKGVGTNEAVGLAVGTNGNNVIRFYNSGLGTAGAITVNSGGTTVAYNTSSDQRLKENIADADDAGSKVDAIQVRKYDWKVDGSHQDYGMIAQELVEVAPEAVSVPEDSEEMMGVDYSKLVPMLIKEIQSLRNRVAQLETGE